jgi:hypothetical protein
VSTIAASGFHPNGRLRPRTLCQRRFEIHSSMRTGLRDLSNRSPARRNEIRNSPAETDAAKPPLVNDATARQPSATTITLAWSAPSFAALKGIVLDISDSMYNFSRTTLFTGEADSSGRHASIDHTAQQAQPSAPQKDFRSLTGIRLDHALACACP